MIEIIREKHKGLFRFLLAAYLLYLFYLVFFSSQYGRASTFQYSIDNANFIPFSTIKHYLRVREYVNTSVVVVNIVGNIVAFMPFGILFPLVLKQGQKYLVMLVSSFILTLFIETIQLVMHVGIFDIDDIILNVIGAILGLFLLRAIGSFFLKGV